MTVEKLRSEAANNIISYDIDVTGEDPYNRLDAMHWHPSFSRILIAILIIPWCVLCGPVRNALWLTDGR
jgi:hypothetical protein